MFDFGLLQVSLGGCWITAGLVCGLMTWLRGGCFAVVLLGFSVLTVIVNALWGVLFSCWVMVCLGVVGGCWFTVAVACWLYLMR